MKRDQEAKKRINPLILPALVLLVLGASVAYYMVLKAEEKEILEKIDSLRLAVEEKRRVLRSLEDLERIKRLPMIAAVARWVQSFNDPLDARMRAEANLTEILRASGAVEAKAKWEDSWEADGLKQGRLSATAYLPSYESVLRVIGSLESGSMPMILRSLEARKEGLRLRVSLTVSVYFRLEHESL